MLRWFKITLWTIGGLLVVAGTLLAYVLYDLRNIEWDFSSADQAHYAAERDFLASLEDINCVTQDVVIAQARARN